MENIFQSLDGKMDWSGANDEQFKPYICVKPVGTSRGALVALQNRIDLPGRLQMTDLHATLMYSIAALSKQLIRTSMMTTLTFVAKPQELEIFGLDKSCLVVKLKCKALEKRNEFWQTLGCKMSFKEYAPHVTLFDKPHLSAPDTTPEDWQFRMESLKEQWNPYVKKMPELVFTGEWVEPVKDKEDDDEKDKD